MLSALECDAKAAERYCDVPAVSEQRKRIHMIYQRLQAISSDQFWVVWFKRTKSRFRRWLSHTPGLSSEVSCEQQVRNCMRRMRSTCWNGPLNCTNIALKWQMGLGYWPLWLCVCPCRTYVKVQIRSGFGRLELNTLFAFMSETILSILIQFIIVSCTVDRIVTSKVHSTLVCRYFGFLGKQLLKSPNNSLVLREPNNLAAQ